MNVFESTEKAITALKELPQLNWHNSFDPACCVACEVSGWINKLESDLKLWKEQWEENNRKKQQPELPFYMSKAVPETQRRARSAEEQTA